MGRIEPCNPHAYLWLAGNEGMEKKMGTTVMGKIGVTINSHSFIPN